MTLTVRIDPAVKTAATARAEQQGEALSIAIRRMLTRYAKGDDQ